MLVRRALAVALLGLCLAPVSALGQAEAEGVPHGAAAAADHGSGAAEAHAVSVPDVIFHHVTDSDRLEFENPITGSTAVFELPRILVPLGDTVLDLSITKHTVFLWIASALLVLVLTLASRKRSLVPRGFYSAMEAFVSFIREEMAVKNIGKHDADKYVGYLCTVFFFILTTNLLGLLPFSATATGNLAVTAALALTSLAMTLVAGMRGQGVVGYWTHLVPAGVPWWLYPIMVPIELLGLISRPFALCIRLFANMVAGHIVIFFLIGLIFLLEAVAIYVAPVSVIFATAMYLLELFVAFLQAYIFTLLTALFIGLASHAH
jgi:F-type H+-transporting ATPase subunit a